MESRPKSPRPCPPGKIIYRVQHGERGKRGSLYTLTSTGRRAYCEPAEFVTVPGERVMREGPTLPQFPLLPADIRKNFMIDLLPVGDLLRLCSTSREYQMICDDPNTWRRLLHRDFPLEPEIEGISPRGLYWALTLLPKVMPTSEGNRFSREDILRRLARGPNVFPIAVMIPLEKIHVYEDHISYRFQGIKNPNVSMILSMTSTYFDVTIFEKGNWAISFISKTPPSDQFIPITTTLIRLIAENYDYVRRNCSYSRFMEILTPIIQRLNLIKGKDRFKTQTWSSSDQRWILNIQEMC